ncbi:MAG: hypothetical protein U1E86_15085 [Burkholderiaceae bacterium]
MQAPYQIHYSLLGEPDHPSFAPVLPAGPRFGGFDVATRTWYPIRYTALVRAEDGTIATNYVLDWLTLAVEHEALCECDWYARVFATARHWEAFAEDLRLYEFRLHDRHYKAFEQLGLGHCDTLGYADLARTLTARLKARRPVRAGAPRSRDAQSAAGF